MLLCGRVSTEEQRAPLRRHKDLCLFTRPGGRFVLACHISVHVRGRRQGCYAGRRLCFHDTHSFPRPGGEAAARVIRGAGAPQVPARGPARGEPTGGEARSLFRSSSTSRRSGPKLGQRRGSGGSCMRCRPDDGVAAPLRFFPAQLLGMILHRVLPTTSTAHQASEVPLVTGFSWPYGQ